jgi:D-alanyl-D-alanine carboxypeptidase
MLNRNILQNSMYRSLSRMDINICMLKTEPSRGIVMANFNYHCKPMNYVSYFMNRIIYASNPKVFLFSLICLSFTRYASASPLPDSTQLKITSPFSVFIKDPINGLMENEEGIRAGLLYDIDRKAVVWEKDMNYAYPVASLTKMMVALLAVEDIKAGNASWTDNIVVSREYWKGSRKHKVRYSVQETYTLEELMKMAMVNSNNEATVWIGKKLAGGTLEPFIKRMNDKCAALGMEHTFYSNPSGLPAITGELDNSSSPNDLLILALELIKYEEILNITSLDYITVGTKNHVYRNHNGLVLQYPKEVDGLKTGYTRNARFCLVATANRGGHRLVCIVLGARSTYTRNAIVAGLMNNYYNVLGLGKLGDAVGDTTLAHLVTDSLNNNFINNPDASSRITIDSSQQGYRMVYMKVKKSHAVKKGETLYSIAGRYDCTAGDIKKWNRLRSSHLYSGQKLVIYQRVEKVMAINKYSADSFPDTEVADKDKPDSAKAKTGTKPKSSSSSVNGDALKGKFVYHIVQPGDTLWNIAQRYAGTTVDKIKKVNKINNSKSLKPGTKLKIQVNS